MAAAKSHLFVVFTNLNNKGRLLLLFSFIVVLLFLLKKVHYSDLLKSEPVFRRSLKRLQLTDDEFCLVTYNILADGPVRQQPNGYLPLSMEEKLKTPDVRASQRHKQLMKELKWLEPDLINLQEVERSHFSVLADELGQLGFQGVHKVHYEKQHGLATFYKTERFEMEKSVSRHFTKLMSKIFKEDQFVDKNKHNERIVLFSHFSDRKTGRSIVVANLHSMFNSWREPDKQALQITVFLRELHEFLTSEGHGKDENIPWIISGDFNTYPKFPLYNIIATGNVSDEDIEKLNPNNYLYPQIIRKSETSNIKTLILEKGRKYLSHPLRDIKSAYKTALGKEPSLTHYQMNKEFPRLYGFDVMKGTLDYIWYSSATLGVNAVLRNVKEESLKALVACPNKYFPSDHLSMKACFGYS